MTTAAFGSGFILTLLLADVLLAIALGQQTILEKSPGK